MKKRTNDKALTLDRETIRRLHGAELADAKGGRDPWWTITTVIFSEAHCTN
jgi:hypothetical protein